MASVGAITAVLDLTTERRTIPAVRSERAERLVQPAHGGLARVGVEVAAANAADAPVVVAGRAGELEGAVQTVDCLLYLPEPCKGSTLVGQHRRPPGLRIIDCPALGGAEWLDALRTGAAERPV